MGHGETHSFIEGFFSPLTHALPWISLIVAGLGILLAYAMYSAKWLSAEKIGSMFKPLYTLFSRKYWFDEFYEDIIVRKALLKGLFFCFQVFDNDIVDGSVNGVANGVIDMGKTVRQAQTGQLQLYGLVMGIGILIIILCVYFFG
jgi:NADH-quinone oxidoreductase subunit L